MDSFCWFLRNYKNRAVKGFQSTFHTQFKITFHFVEVSIDVLLQNKKNHNTWPLKIHDL